MLCIVNGLCAQCKEENSGIQSENKDFYMLELRWWPHISTEHVSAHVQISMDSKLYIHI